MREGGFTLVEVLVSLAIFSIAILGLGRAATLAVSSTSALQMRTHAGFVADNMVVLDRLDPVETGVERRTDDSGGIRFEAELETRETQQADFYEIEVRVRQAETDRVWAVRRAFRYDAPPPVPRPASAASDEDDDGEEEE